jgi:beta-glucanase (GH16 family)
MNSFISKQFGDLKIEGKYNKGEIISQGKFILYGRNEESNKIRNIKI